MSRIARMATSTVLAGLLAAFALTGVSPATAQTPTDPTPTAQTPTDSGAISGTIQMGTAGEALPGGVVVELIELGDSGVTSRRTEADAQGAYRFDAPVDPAVRYLPRVQYEGVQYFGTPVILTAAEPTAVVDPITVYSATDVPPELSISETIVTAIALDRTLGQIGFVREDLVTNPSDRAYVGGPGGTTLRIPMPEGTLDAAGENADGDFAFEDGILATTTPIRALDATSIVTRFLVEYDVVDDRYLLRVTVPVAAERITLRVPRDYVRNLHPEGTANFAPDETVTAASGEAVALATIRLSDARPGDSLVVELDGLAVQVNHNPLAEAPGSLIGFGIALIALTAAAIGVVAMRRQRPEASAA